MQGFRYFSRIAGIPAGIIFIALLNSVIFFFLHILSLIQCVQLIFPFIPGLKILLALYSFLFALIFPAFPAFTAGPPYKCIVAFWISLENWQITRVHSFHFLNPDCTDPGSISISLHPCILHKVSICGLSGHLPLVRRMSW